MTVVKPTIVRPTGSDLEALQKAARLLKQANFLFGKAKRDSTASKEAISEWLKKERKIDIETLPIGEMVTVEGVCIVERGKKNKFDDKAFLLANPQLHEKFKKDFPTNRFHALV